MSLLPKYADVRRKMREMEHKSMARKAEAMMKRGNAMNAKIAKGSMMDKMVSGMTKAVSRRVGKK